MAVFELSAINKSFGAIQALKDVDFSVDTGEVVGLMGDNGAGKKRRRRSNVYRSRCVYYRQC